MTVTERAPLNRALIAETALSLIDERGLDQLSMRKLGAELGVEAMSLYNHVANKDDLLDAVADRFAIPTDKVLSNLASYGNTSAATIPLMLDEAVRDGRIQPGHSIASSGFGAGLSWGAALLRWSGPA